MGGSLCEKKGAPGRVFLFAPPPLSLLPTQCVNDIHTLRQRTMADPHPAIAALAAAAATARGPEKGAIAARLARHYAHAASAEAPAAEAVAGDEDPAAARVITKARAQAAAIALLGKGIPLPPALAATVGGKVRTGSERMGGATEKKSRARSGELLLAHPLANQPSVLPCCPAPYHAHPLFGFQHTLTCTRTISSTSGAFGSPPPAPHPHAQRGRARPPSAGATADAGRHRCHPPGGGGARQIAYRSGGS